MKCGTICVVVLLIAASANAGQNPGINVFLELANGTNYMEPVANRVITVYVCLECPVPY